MTNRVRTLDFLPEIFRTKSNEEFLTSTLDTLAQAPKVQKLQGYVGSKFGYGVGSSDKYLTEPTQKRSNYQLNPAVVFKKKATNIPLDVMTYPELTDALHLAGSVAPESKLFSNQFYSFDSFCDLDKLVNYSQYYWLPGGPEAVTVSNTLLTKSIAYTITSSPLAFSVSAKNELIGDHNPELTLVRGGTYYFNVSQDSPFYIQMAKGVSGHFESRPNISTRDIFGLQNNGVSTGTIKFEVPAANAQADWELSRGIDIDLVTTLNFNDIHSKPAGSVSIDGITDLDGKTVLFYGHDITDTGNITKLFDTTGEEFDNTSFDETAFSRLSAHVFRIVYVGDPVNGQFIEMVEADPLPINALMKIKYGTQYNGRDFVKNEYGEIILAPFVTAPCDTYYYQHGENSEIYGVIRIVDREDSSFINVNNILGKQTYTSPNGVVFSNGLKVEFAGNIYPTEYATGQYYVEGVGTSIELVPISELIVPERFAYAESSDYDGQPYDVGPFNGTTFLPIEKDYITIARNSKNKNAWSRGNRWFHIDVLKTTIEHNPGAKLASRALGNVELMAKRPIIEFYPNLKMMNSGTSSVNNITYINFTETDALKTVAGSLDFLPDGALSTLYNGAKVLFANDNSTEVKTTVYSVFYSETVDSAQVVITNCSDVTVNSDGSANVTYTIPAQETVIPKGKYLSMVSGANSSFQGTYKVVASTNTQVTLLYPTAPVSNWDNIGSSYLITNLELTLTPFETAKYMDQVTVASGAKSGKIYYFDGSSWLPAQEKTYVNQMPLFDIVDANGHSLSDMDFYPSTTFSGSTLFQYSIGSGANDPELHFPVKYNFIQNVGDIEFTVSLNSETFVYNLNGKEVTENVRTGYVVNDGEYQLGWQTAVEESFQYQVFNMVYTGTPFEPTFICDVPVKSSSDTAWATSVVYVDNVRKSSADYTITTDGKTTTVTLVDYPSVGTTVDIMLLSDLTSQIGYYQIPLNLDHNPYNEQITALTLGDLRGHYKTMFNNAPGLTGQAFGANNFRDLANLVPYGTRIIQNSAPLTLPAAFLRNNGFNFFDAITFNSNEYAKYKALLVNTLENNDFTYIDTASGLLDEVVEIITEPKTSTNSFFWSDMLPAKNKTSSKVYTFKSVLDNAEFNLTKIYDFENANYSSVLVYLTRKEATGIVTTQLTRTVDYVVSADEAKLVITKELVPGDKIEINEYHQTYASFVPSTPTKLGLYPAFIPEVVLDSSYVTPTWFIKGHDGSYNRLYGQYNNGVLTDARDRVLFEFEQRVFNNLKVLNKTTPIKYADVVPGFFRTSTDETATFSSVYETQFMNWVGMNRIDYKSQSFDQSNDWTWNYSGSKIKLNNTTVAAGGWRGIYLWLYDTTTPHFTPWEMLGLTIKPTWWDSHYGEAPYTSDNLIMWQDIANGYVWNNGNSYIVDTAIRPGLMSIIPVDSQGRLVSPFGNCISSYDVGTFKQQWMMGDVGPAEYAYRKSSAWAFDLVRVIALQSPAKFFNLNIDLDYYQYSAKFNQFLTNERYRISPPEITIYGTDDTTAAHSYINWIVDYVNQSGSIGSEDIKSLFNNTDVRLTYNVAGFTNKDMIKFFTENSSASSSKASLIPEDSYSILLHRNQAVDSITYTSVIIQRSDAGYRVYGNKLTNAFFEVFTPISGLYQTVSVNGKSLQIATKYSPTPAIIPYGHEFKTIESLLEFVKGYGLFLESQGMKFDDTENSVELNWDQMISEILYWIQTGWDVGSTVNVNPAANVLRINTPNAIVEPLTLSKQNFVLNQNLLPISLTDLSIHRNGTELTIKALNAGDALSYFTGHVGSIEHIVVFDNKTEFGDTIVNLVTGLRQQRLYVKGTKTDEWQGYVNNAGFIMSLDSITDWVQNAKYIKGQVVKYKNDYWMANKSIINPSSTFETSNWVKTSYDLVQQRMLPNQSTRSLESTMFYDLNSSNISVDSDLLGFSLIGYRPRDYMASADLSSVSQVKMHSEAISVKGTTSASTMLNNASIKGENVEYTVHENWAIKNAEFGGINNHNYVQFGLSESLLSSNPATVSLISHTRVDGVDQEVAFSDVTNYGRTLANEFILPELAKDTDEVLRSAGYVHLDDVIETGYSVDNFNDAAINAIYRNDYIWVANKDNKWDVFTPVPVASQVVSASNNLNGTVTIVFNAPHGILTNQVIGLQNFDTRFDGYHVVESVPSLTSLIVYKSVDSTVTSVTGSGLVFLLQSYRVNTPRDIPYLPLNHSEYDPAKVWVDQSSDGSWKVFKKELNYKHTQVGEKASTSSLGDAVAYVPGIGYFAGDKTEGTVTVFASIKDDGVYYPKSSITYSGTNFGSAIKHANKTIVISAPHSTISQIFIYRDATEDGFSQPVLEQTIVWAGAASDIVGESIAISGDGNHIFMNAKSGNYDSVFMYSLDPSLLKTGLGLPLASDITVNSNSFSVDGNATQTIKDGQRISFATSFAQLAPLAENFVPDRNDAVDNIRESFKLSGNQTSLLSNGDTVSFGNTHLKNTLFTVILSSYLPDEDKTMFYIEQQPVLMVGLTNGVPTQFPTINAGTMVYKVSFDDSAVYTVLTKSYVSATNKTIFYVQDKFNHSVPSGSQLYLATMNYELVSIISTSEVVGYVPGDNFGASIATNYDGTKLFIGAPKHNQSGSQIATGTMYAFDRLSQTFEVQRDIPKSSTHIVVLPWYPSISALVYKNGKRLRTNQYVLILNAIYFGHIGFDAGDIITIKDSKVVQTGSFINGAPDTLRSGQWFGYSMDCSSDGTELIVGAPYALTSDGYEGAVYRFTDPGKRYGMLVGVTPAALNEPTYLLLNGYKVNAFNVIGMQSSVTTNSTSVTLSVSDAKLLPASGVIRFRKNTNDTFDIAYNKVNPTTGVVSFGTVGYISGYTTPVNDSNAVVQDGTLVRLTGNITKGMSVSFTDVENVSGLMTIESYSLYQLDQANTVLYTGDLISGTTLTRLYASRSDAMSGTNPLQVQNINTGNAKTLYAEQFPYSVTCTSSDTQIYAPLGSATNIANKINESNITNIFAYATEDGRLVIRLRDMSLAPSMNKLNLSVFNGNFWTMLGMMPYPMTQTITSPHKEHNTKFGFSVKYNEANSFVVGAPTSTRFAATRFDYTDATTAHTDTAFDNNMTLWEESFTNAGAVYMYDYIDSYEEALDNMGKYVYSQPCNDTATVYGAAPMFGSSVDFNNNRVVVGSPGFDGTGGKVIILKNDVGTPNWSVHRTSEQVVDISKISKIQLFDNTTNVSEASLDYFDPLQGKLLSVVEANIDFTRSSDPAAYNNGDTTVTISWGADQVGKIWFNTANVRFYNYHQKSDVQYNSKYWGVVFPGSDVAVYTWVESNVTPALYTGTGTVLNTTQFSVSFTTDSTNALVPKYYFWVKNTNILSASLGKTLPDSAIATYIQYPQESGVPFVAPLRTNVFGLYNSADFINGGTTSIHIGFSTSNRDVSGHTEFKLISTNSTDFLPGLPDRKKGETEPYGLYAKYIDSFAGEDVIGATVPDASLPKLMQIGVSVRPRQSMFVDRLLALKNFIEYTNNVMSQYPVAETSAATFLHVATDTVDTTKYWDYAYWWATGYSEKTRPKFEVESLEDLKTIPVVENLIVSVSKNSNGNREVYTVKNSEWVRIGLENGTYQFLSTVYDYSPEGIGFGNGFFDLEMYDSNTATETRYIVRAINEQIFVGDLEHHRNKSLTLMFEYIQSENIESHNYLPWLNKTKFADVNYKVRTLKQTPKYIADETTLVEGYINEIKPYSVVIKEFVETYASTDVVNGTVTDFDLPAYYDFEAGKFVSPQVVFGVSSNPDQKAINDAVWGDYRYFDWMNNLGMSIKGGEAQHITNIVEYADATTTDIYVENAYTLPYQGIMFLGDEQIGYTSIDRHFGKLIGVTRGANNTPQSIHHIGTPVYMYTPDVFVLNPGKNYQLPPKITAYIDTSIYPEPRSEAIFEAVMQDDKVVGVTVIQPGEGYVTTPELIVEPSATYTFDNFSSDAVNANNLINTTESALFTSIDVSQNISSYDVVKVESITTGSPVIANGFYYVKVSQGSGNFILTFFETYKDAKTDKKGIQFNKDIITNGYVLNVHVTAQVLPTMKTTGVRGLKTTVKFDRVSYTSKVKEWKPNTYWSSPYSSLGNDASSSEESSASMILSSSQGVVLPITGVRNQDGFAVVGLDYTYSNIKPGQLDGALLQFYKVTPSYTPAIVDGTNGRAEIQIFRPKFGGNSLSEVYTIKIINPGSIYMNDYTIRISGSELGGQDGVNDATILIKYANENTGAILVASISGRAAGTFDEFYVKPVNDSEVNVYVDAGMIRRAPFNGFIWNGALNATQAFGETGNDYAYLPEPVVRDVFSRHDEVSLVSYAGVIWACKESNSDAEFDPAKWTAMTTADVAMTALERIDGFYQPTAGMVPKDHQQLLKGITYPNTVYFGNKFAPEDIVDEDVILTDNLFTNSEADVKGVVFVDTKYVAVATYQGSTFVLTQTVSGTWQSSKIIEKELPVTSFTCANEIYTITTSDDSNPLFVSFDGVRWIGVGERTTFDTLDYDDGSYDDSSLQVELGGILNSTVINDKFFTVGYKIDTSIGGLVWETQHQIGNKNRIHKELTDIAYVDTGSYTGYLAIGSQIIITSGADTPAPELETAALLLTSPDSINWTSVSPVTTEFIPVALVVTSEIVVVVCKSGKIVYTDNATTWIEASIIGDTVTADIIDVAYGNGMFLAITASDVILTSTDGMAWEQTISPVNSILTTVTFTNGNFVLTGTLGTICISSNCVTWENILIQTASDTTYVVKGNDFLFGYGPEELVAGVVTDTVNMTITSAPGAYWNRDGSEQFWYYASGFSMIQVKRVVDTTLTVTFDEVVANGAGASVFIVETDGSMTRMYENFTATALPYTYHVNWCTKTVTFDDDYLIGKTVLLELYEFGNAVERQRASTETMPLFDDINTGHSSINTGLPMLYGKDIEPVVYAQKQGEHLTRLTFGLDFSTYRNDEDHLILALGDTYDAATDYVVYSIVRTGKSTDDIDEHYVSLPETQFFTEGGTEFVISLEVTKLPIPNFRNSIPSAIVEVDGKRLRDLHDYLIDENTFTLTLLNEVDAGQVVAVTMFNGITRQYMSTAHETMSSDELTFSLTIPSPVSLVPSPMAPIVYTNGQRAWVTVDGNRIDPSLVSFGDNNVMSVNYPVQAGQIVMATAMVSSAAPNEQTYRIEIDKHNNKVIRRMNTEDTTWLVAEINEADTEIRVAKAEYLVEAAQAHSTVEQLDDGTLYAFTNSFFSDVSGVMIFDVTKGLTVPYDFTHLKMIAGRPAVVFNDFVDVGDELTLTLYRGDTVEINGEKIHFTEVDLTNNLLLGITRGAYGTQIQTHHPVNSRIISLSSAKVMDSKYYDMLWTDSEIFEYHRFEIPLQLSNTEPAKFLRMNNI